MPESEFTALLRGVMIERDVSLRALARRVPIDAGQLSRVLNGKRPSSDELARRCDAIFDTGALFAQTAERVRVRAAATTSTGTTDDDAVELEAVELARRVEASDVGDATLTRLGEVADELAMAYPTTPPGQLLTRARRHLNYVTHLIEARKTLTQHHRLLVTGGWLSLLTATLCVDLRQNPAGHGWLTTATQLADTARDAEIRAWCAETQAWAALIHGRFHDALTLSQQAQVLAPAGSSVLIQATAQEGRAWARLGRPAETRDALARVERMVNNLPTPEHPEHHYRYDPTKALSYTATTLAWVGDPAAEELARTAIQELNREPGGVPRPRRAALARLDLALALLATGRPDEASAEALTAVTSGRITPADTPRATEVLHGIEHSGTPQATELRDAFRTASITTTAPPW